MGSFGGFGGLFGGGKTATITQFVPTPKILIGHVLDVCLDSSSDLHKGSDENVGTILFRDVFGPHITDLNKREKGLKARPADRSNFKIPLPGEQVLVYYAYQDKITPSLQLVPGYFYGPVITNTANVTNNSSPYVGISPARLRGVLPISAQQVDTRFDKRISNLKVFKGGDGSPVIHKQMQPFEGDYILQGRFGNSIRFGSTPTDASADSGPTWTAKRRGKPGDSIITIRVNNEIVSKNKVKTDLYDLEDINEDAASIYLTTTQEIPFALAVPDKGGREHPLASWAYVYGVAAPEVLPSETHMFDGETNAAAENKATTGLKEGTVLAAVVGATNSVIDAVLGGDGLVVHDANNDNSGGNGPDAP